uniref:Voltage-dependent calcium channel gamma-7 subunit n=1 Tax=Sphaerodactylus townsendi TaxID=933632 RepID=A0ACB8EVQ9_9SAUR
MSNCSSRALTLLSSVFGACGLLLVGIAVSTDYWLFMEEGIVFPQNQTTEIVMALHAGLWRVCFFAGQKKGSCVASEYFLEPRPDPDPEGPLVTENTENILRQAAALGALDQENDQGEWLPDYKGPPTTAAPPIKKTKRSNPRPPCI